MSGGVAYVYDEDGMFKTRCNTEMVKVIPVDSEGAAEIKKLVTAHLDYTGSEKAAALLKDWTAALGKFVCIMPNDYARMVKAIKKAHEDGYSGDEALMIAFDANNATTSRV